MSRSDLMVQKMFEPLKFDCILFVFLRTYPLWKEIYSKRKEFAPKGGFDRIVSPEKYPVR